MTSITELKVSTFEENDNNELNIEFEVLPVCNPNELDDRRKEIYKNIEDVDKRLEEVNKKVQELNTEIERLTNHADNFDYAVAVGAGVLCGLIDSFFVGEFDFKKVKAAGSKDNAHEQVNRFIEKFAKLNGYQGKGLNGAIDFLEKKYPVAQDNIWKGADIGVSAKNHHLADFAHHPTLLGLGAAIVVQFFRIGIFVNKDGKWHFEFVSTDPKELLKVWLPVIISGLLLWMINIAESKYKDEIDDKIPKPIQKLIKALAAAPMVISILKVAVNWAGHLVSDMGGSKNTAGGGMGIPGLFISLLHEISSLPGINQTELPKIVNDLYTKGKMDMRSELAFLNEAGAVIKELGRQAIPVIIGEVLVRTFYFVRHLIQECREHDGDWKSVNWKNVIPFKNRTIARMLAIESGTFTAVDLADAAIEGAIDSAKQGGPANPAAFFGNMILRVNFVGIGRFCVAVATDVGMGIKRSIKRNERIKVMSEQIHLTNAIVFYKQADKWISAQEADIAIEEALSEGQKAIVYCMESYNEIEETFDKIDSELQDAELLNPGLTESLEDILQWG